MNLYISRQSSRSRPVSPKLAFESLPLLSLKPHASPPRPSQMSLQLLPIVPQLLKASARRTATWSASLRSLRRTTSGRTTLTRLDAGSSTRRYSSPNLSSSLRPAVALSAVGAKGRRSFEQLFSSSSAQQTPFRLADIGEGITECEVVKW
jgi:hypothetical protein